VIGIRLSLRLRQQRRGLSDRSPGTEFSAARASKRVLRRTFGTTRSLTVAALYGLVVLVGHDLTLQICGV